MVFSFLQFKQNSKFIGESCLTDLNKHVKVGNILLAECHKKNMQQLLLSSVSKTEWHCWTKERDRFKPQELYSRWIGTLTKSKASKSKLREQKPKTDTVCSTYALILTPRTWMMKQYPISVWEDKRLNPRGLKKLRAGINNRLEILICFHLFTNPKAGKITRLGVQIRKLATRNIISTGNL